MLFYVGFKYTDGMRISYFSRYFIPNYRPISLLNIFSKVLEKLMISRLKSFLNKFKILYDCQFGFGEGHSTNIALIDIHDSFETLKIKEIMF